MAISARKRIALGVMAAALIVSLSACGVETAQEDFKKDLGTQNLSVDGNITVDKEKQLFGKKKETLEALIKLKDSTAKCRVELERPKKATGGDTFKDRKVQAYTIGELVTSDGNEINVDSKPGVYDMNAIVTHIRNNAEWRTLCFA